MNVQPNFSLSNYKISLGVHKDKPVIFFDFPYNPLIRSQLAAKLKIFWSKTNKKWYALDTPQYRELCQLPQKNILDYFLPKIYPINQIAFKDLYEELILRGYSPNTIKTYLSEFYQLLKLLKSYPVSNLNYDKLRDYMFYCAQTLMLKEATLHSRLNAIKFYYEKVKNQKEFTYTIPRPQKPSQLPKVISKQDIKKMLELTSNLKHRLALKLVYGMGLRVSEIVALKITDIDSKRMMVHIRSAKGKRDRYVPLPESALIELRTYYREYKPKDYLFEGSTSAQYTKRTVQAVFKQALHRAGINKKIGIHGLRHSYATHLLESGTDSLFIQKLLGHKDIKTTLIYTRVSQPSTMSIKSPLDNLG